MCAFQPKNAFSKPVDFFGVKNKKGIFLQGFITSTFLLQFYFWRLNPKELDTGKNVSRKNQK